MLAELIQEYIRAQYRSGKTQEQIAKDLNCDHPTINRLISGRRSAGKLFVATFDKMFPQAQISLTGGPVTVGEHNTGPVAGIHAGDNFFTPAESAAAPPEVAAVLSSPLSPSEKAAILHEIYALQKRKDPK